ncbi:MAG: uracil-DNA glycosylase [Planctomycetaceae bacterium]|nr:uracil-DNA glycosylase [Planctomycetaceae bacterium]
MNAADLPPDWRNALAEETSQPWFVQLCEFVQRERQTGPVFPPAEDVFQALALTPLANVRVLILGQDPYHDDGQAHGLSFSVRPGVKVPPSLRNIYKELQTDLEIAPAPHGHLQKWAQQGVLLLNTVLTVRAHQAHSHRKQGWETLTDRIIQIVSDRPAVAFVLWGKPAEAKEKLIDSRHLIVKSPHPSPLSARRGFFGSRPFSRVNEFLARSGLPQIDWDVGAAGNSDAPVEAGRLF